MRRNRADGGAARDHRRTGRRLDGFGTLSQPGVRPFCPVGATLPGHCVHDRCSSPAWGSRDAAVTDLGGSNESGQSAFYGAWKGTVVSKESVVKHVLTQGTSLGGTILLIAVGILEVVQSISALAGDEVIVTGIEYTYQFDVIAWGGVHLVLGVIAVASGIALFTGAAWARVGAVVICAVSILVNFLWLPYYPAGAVTIIALNAVVIWAVATWNIEET